MNAIRALFFLCLTAASAAFAQTTVPPPAVRITAVAVPLGEQAAGTTVPFTVTLRNTADNPAAGGYTVTINLVGPTAISGSTGATPPIPAGGTVTTTVNVAIPGTTPGGTFFVTAVASAVAGQTDPTGLTFSPAETLVIGQPRLSISRVVVSPTSVASGGVAIGADITLVNTGLGATTAGSSAQVTLDLIPTRPELLPTDIEDPNNFILRPIPGTISVPVPNIAPGGTATIRFDGNLPEFNTPGGQYIARVSVAGAGTATAANRLSVNIQPDLIIENLVYAPGAYRPGDLVDFRINWFNRLRDDTGRYSGPSLPAGGQFYRIEIVASVDPIFGNADDFLLTFFDVPGGLPGNTYRPGEADLLVRRWQQVMPGNLPGLFHVLARINVFDTGFNAGDTIVQERIRDNLSRPGDNTWPIASASPDLRLVPGATAFPTVERISLQANGLPVAEASHSPSVSADARFTAFVSRGADIVAGLVPSFEQVFLRDALTQRTILISGDPEGRPANGTSLAPRISADGRWIVFQSDANNLVPGDTNRLTDVFLADTATREVFRISVASDAVQANGASTAPTISGDGRFIAFETRATNLVAGHTPGRTHVVVLDRQSGTLRRLSAAADGLEANGDSLLPALSADGSTLAFASFATNLVTGVTAGVRQIYGVNVNSGTVTLISRSSEDQPGNAASVEAALSETGRYVAFSSFASNLVALDSNGVSDIFVHDRQTSQTVRVSVASDGSEAQDTTFQPELQSGSVQPSISLDGRYVAFASKAANLAPGDLVGQFISSRGANNAQHVYVHDRDATSTGVFDQPLNRATTRVSVNRFGYEPLFILGQESSVAGSQPAISGNGRFVAYATDADGSPGVFHGVTNRTSPDSNQARDVALHDRQIQVLPTNYDTTPPSGFGRVILSAPSLATAGPLPLGSSVVLSATAAIPGRAVREVRFFANGQLLGTDTVAPYTFTAAPAFTGSVTYTAVAVDANFATYTSDPLTVAVGIAVGAAPTVRLTNPVNGSTVAVGGANPTPPFPVILEATAADADGRIESVQFFVDGVALGAPDTSVPYRSAVWLPQTAGTYVLQAVATDDKGNRTVSSTVTVTGTASVPTAAIISPIQGTTVAPGSVIPIIARVAARTGASSDTFQVNFYANGNLIGQASGANNASSAQTTWSPVVPGTYVLNVGVSEAVGQTEVLSAPVTVTVQENQAPTVRLTNPVANTTVRVGSSVFLAVQSGDPDGRVLRVEYFVNGVNIGGTDVAPFSFVWTPQSVAQNVLIEAVAIDTFGGTARSAPVPVSVIAAAGLPPTVVITTPQEAIVGTSNSRDERYIRSVSDIPLNAVAVGVGAGVRITQVDFFVDGQLIGSRTASPFGLIWQPRRNGSYSIVASATDSNGNTSFSTPVNAILVNPASNPPSVRIINPRGGVTADLGSSINVEVEATDDDGGISEVRLLAGGVQVGRLTEPPYVFQWRPSVAGVYDLQAIALDNDFTSRTTVEEGTQFTTTVTFLANQIASSAVNVAVRQPSSQVGAAPTVAITGPLPAVPGGSVTATTLSRLNVNATAFDSDGEVVDVEFFVNGTSVGLGTREGASFNYRRVVDFATLGAGSFSLVARVRDNAGNFVSSTPVSVTVSGASQAAPTVSILPDAFTAPLGRTVLLRALAASSVGSITSVQFFANGTQVGSASTAAPFATSWSPGAPGTYVVVATATDNAGTVVTSEPATVVITGQPKAPTLTFLRPAIDDLSVTVEVDTVLEVRVTPATVGAAVTNVSLFANGQFLGTATRVATTDSYTFTWRPSSGLFGSVSLVAVAADSLGATGSTSRKVTVSAQGGGGGGGEIVAGVPIYTGLYTGFDANGQLAGLVADQNLYLIGFNTFGSPTAFSASRINVSGGAFSIPSDAAGRPAITGTATGTGLAGTFASPTATFIATSRGSNGATRPFAAAYQGTAGSRPVLLLAGAEGTVALFVGGSAAEAGIGALTESGSFAVTTNRGRAFTGTISLSGAVTGTGPDGSFTASRIAPALASGRAVNLSTRGVAGTGPGTMIAGFVIEGSAAKDVMVRAVGPSLGQFGVAGAVPNPTLKIYDREGRLLAFNDDWGVGSEASRLPAAFATVGAFGLSSDSLDAGTILRLAPGSYSAHVEGSGGLAGVALLEVYDLSADRFAEPSSRLVNLSARAEVGAAGAILIPGLVVDGASSRTFLVRAVGPTLGQFGVANPLAATRLSLFARDAQMAENTGWAASADAAAIASAASRVGAFALPSGSADSALLVTLEPGAYTLQVTGANGSSGVALVEVYEVR